MWYCVKLSMLYKKKKTMSTNIQIVYLEIDIKTKWHHNIVIGIYSNSVKNKYYFKNLYTININT